MGELWITEMGWRGLAGVSGQRELQARNLAEVFVTAKATEAEPFARFDRMCWYSFLDGDIESNHGGHGVIDTDYLPKPSLYASCQTAAQLVGKRLNGRVLVGDSRDDSVRIYEFEDPATAKRMWVGWRNGQDGDQGEPTVAVQIPVRCDDPQREDLDYDGSSSPVSDTAEPSGWLATDLANRPQFIYEPEVDYIARPDLRADSVWSQPPEPQPSQQCSLYVRVINHGSAATPDGSLISGAPNTVARFYLDDSLVGSLEYSTSIGMGDTVLLAAAWTPNAATQGLLRGTVNDDQAYVEEALDDNAAFLLLDISN